MAVSKYGFSSLNQDLNPSDNGINLSDQLSQLKYKTISARVTDIILDDLHPKFSTYGEWNGIGTIEFEIIGTSISDISTKSYAKPLIPYFKNYPLVNEIVLLFNLPTNSNIEEVDGGVSYFYLNSISIWNHPHHNAYPNPITGEDLPPNQSKDYKSIEGGSVRRVEDNSTEINLNGDNPSGGIFKEKTNIHPVLPFVGDNILEGRFGNSIRLGSTAKSKSIYANNWSTSGEEGDPISIIRNGQPLNSTNKGWEPTVENINKDLSSIYLTSTQQVPIDIASKNYTGIREDQIPTYPLSYKSNQIILNSGRLVLNSSVDSILLSSKKVIALSAIGDIGLSTRDNINLSGKEIHLGGTTASESLMMGDTFIKQFKVLLDGLNQLCDALITEPTLKSTPLVATGIKNIITTMNNQSDNFLSKISKTL